MKRTHLNIFRIIVISFASLFLFSNRGGEQDIQLTNDKRVVSHYNDPKSAGKAADPGKVFCRKIAKVNLECLNRIKLSFNETYIKVTVVFSLYLQL